MIKGYEHMKKAIKTAVSILLLILVTASFPSCRKTDGGDVTEKPYRPEFPDVSEIQYDPLDYITVKPLSEIRISESELSQSVNYAIVSILLQMTEMTEYTEAGSKTVQPYDAANITFTGKPTDKSLVLSEDTLAGMTNADSEEGSVFVIGSGSAIGKYHSDDPEKCTDGFEEQIIGRKIGESFTIHVTFPDNYGLEELRGVPVDFDITVNSLSRAELPEFTDEICKDYTGYESAEEYREFVRTYYLGNLSYNAVLENVTVKGWNEDVVKVYFDKYVDYSVCGSLQDGYTKEEYEELFAEFSVSMKDDATEYAHEVAEERMILKYLFDICGISMNEEEFSEALENDYHENFISYLENYGINSSDGLIEYFGKDELKISYMFDLLLKTLPSKLGRTE